MSGEKNLNKLLQTMTATLNDGVYVFTTLPNRNVPEKIKPRMMFQEAEGTTLVLLEEEAQAHGFIYEFPSRMITLDVHSSLEAVGFIARIANVLADHNMGINPISGFFHDHVFVPVGREEEALRLIRQIAEESA